MKRARFLIALACLAIGGGSVSAHGGVAIGFHFGLPLYIGPGWGCGYCYRPYPVYVAPPPVVLQPVPVYQPVPVATYPAPVPAPSVSRSPVTDPAQAEIERHLQMLASADERTRADSAMQLGRLKAEAAVDPLAATLAGDRSPSVRETAARALALIGSKRALPALERAAQADPDRDVRHSAQFASDVVLANRNP